MIMGHAAAENPAPRAWTAEEQALIDQASVGALRIAEGFERWVDGYHEEWSYWRIDADETRPRDVHMGLVRDYIDAGNEVIGFELTPIDVIINGDSALLRLHATETLLETNENERVVRYASAAFYIRDGDAWKLRATNIHYLPDPQTESGTE